MLCIHELLLHLVWFTVREGMKEKPQKTEFWIQITIVGLGSKELLTILNPFI